MFGKGHMYNNLSKKQFTQLKMDMAGHAGADDSGTDDSLYQHAQDKEGDYHEYKTVNPDDILDVRVAQTIQDIQLTVPFRMVPGQDKNSNQRYYLFGTRCMQLYLSKNNRA